MNVQLKNKQKGFTIIEVVLVLAIAGLIFLMVFIALPALQRNQRDTQRKNDLSRAQTAINSYQSNNRGAVPESQTDWNRLKTDYLQVNNDTFTDPSGEDYTFDDLAVSQTVPNEFAAAQNKMYYTGNATCGNDGAATAAGARKVVLRMRLEGGGVACVNN